MEIEYNHIPSWFMGMKNHERLVCATMTQHEMVCIKAIISAAVKAGYVPEEILPEALAFLNLK